MVTTTAGHPPGAETHSTQMQSSLSLRERWQMFPSRPAGHLTAGVVGYSSAGHHTRHLGNGHASLLRPHFLCVLSSLCHRSKTECDRTLASASSLCLLHPLLGSMARLLCPQTAPCHCPSLSQAHRGHSHQGNLPWLLSPLACLQGLQGLGDPREKNITTKT